MSEKGPFIEIRNLVKYFPVTAGVIKRKIADIKAVDGISFYMRRGETLGLVGESGCGKTTTGRCIVQLYRPSRGEVLFDGIDLCKLKGKRLRRMRKNIQMVFQDPFGSLNPRMRVGQILAEPLYIHKLASGRELPDRVSELLKVVGLDPTMANRYPHEFSGGQRQRIGIARALAAEPTFMVCDEPVSALDVSIQAQIINLFIELKVKFGLTYLFIAHDLSVVRYISNRIAVMYLGDIVEMNSSAELFDFSLHPYTKALISAVPIPDPFLEEKRERIVLIGDVPSALNPPQGCKFHPRCSYVLPQCRKDKPVLKNMGGEHWLSCHLI